MRLPVDAHAHVWLIEPQEYPWQPLVPGLRPPAKAAPVEELLGALDSAGLAQAVLTQPAIYGADNRYLAACLARYPDRLAGICLVDPQAAPAVALMYWLNQPGFCGVRLNPGLEQDCRWLDAPSQAELWEAAAAAGVPISLRIAPRQLVQLENMLRCFPRTFVVVDYLNPEAYADLPTFPAFEQLGRLARYPQVFVKILPLAGLSRQEYPFPDLFPAYERLYQAFGGRRLIWGSSWPDTRAALDHRHCIAWAGSLPFLTPGDQEWLLGRTAAELWRLPAQPERREETNYANHQG